MLTITIFLPVLGMLAVILSPAARPGLVRTIGLGASGLTLLLAIGLTLTFDPGSGLQFEGRIAWIPALGVGYSVGLDGLSLPLFLLTAFMFFISLVFSWHEDRRIKEYFVWFLFLETAALGVFAALDLFLFYVFWDLTLVGMYFIIAIWGHNDAKASALKFFLYTFVGSLALLLGIIGLYLAMDPLTMDMPSIIAANPLAGDGTLARVVFFALLIGLGVKIPVFPLHTWLPPAHADAPAPGSAILAGVLLKLGTYGLLRIGLPMLPETFRSFAPLLIAIGVVSIFWGALVALAQKDLKRLIAYTSVNHMGYIVMAVGAVAMAGSTSVQAAQVATNGAILQMISHGLITGALFLLAGVLYKRTGTYEIARYGGLAAHTPLFAGAFGLAAFASLGLPGLSGFAAEFQIFAGTFGIAPLAAILGVVGIVITAGLFLWTIQRVMMGDVTETAATVTAMTRTEKIAIGALLALVVLIGIMPQLAIGLSDGFAARLASEIGGV
ncbi:complex I subunit 4 family protein [Aurantimonas marina]|uniref:complex I subunit 4 family protein n=1 Tax=Aurantimonas marina TaxID=2780508 RepID=UPI0019D058B6|nr:NADH-quinone oxidoreductase subunit M [Aurantimonas marina]